MAQILPDSGNQVGKTYAQVTEDSIALAGAGTIKSMACGSSFTRYNRCFRWTPLDDKTSQACFRTNHAQLRFKQANPDPNRKMMWRQKSEHKYSRDYSKFIKDKKFGFLYFESETAKDWGGKNGLHPGWAHPIDPDSHYAGKWRRGAQTLEIECSDKNAAVKIVGDKLNYLNLFAPPNIAEATEDCLLAERQVQSTSTTYWYDRTRFMCIPVKDISFAEKIVENYRDFVASHEGFEHLKKRPFDPTAKFYFTFSEPHMPYSDMCQAALYGKIISADKAAQFYRDSGIKSEIGDGAAAVLFAIDEKDCDAPQSP